jgi:hypothetical protein
VTRKTSTESLLKQTEVLHRKLADLWGIEPALVRVTIHDVEPSVFDGVVGVTGSLRRWYGDERTNGPYCSAGAQLTRYKADDGEAEPLLLSETVTIYCDSDRHEHEKG